jgi:dipeptidyl aminopeptidase/acylaminoacyl peptidase
MHLVPCFSKSFSDEFGRWLRSRRVALLAFAALATLLPAPDCAAADPKPWTLDDILAVRAVTDPQVSPDGRWVAYVVSALKEDGSDYQTDVWLAAVEGGAARRLTASAVADEFPRWSPDGKALGFLSDRPRSGEHGTDDEGKRQLWTIAPDGGEAVQLSDAPGGVSAFEWSRDGKFVAYLSREPKTEVRKKAEKNKDDAWTPSSMFKWNRLWTLDLASRKTTQLTSGDSHVSSFSISPDGKQIAFAAQPTPLIPDQFNSDLWLIAAAGGERTPLVQQKGSDTSPAFSPDGRWIAFISQAGRSTDWWTNNYACIIAPTGGPITNLTEKFDERIEGLSGGGIAWTPDSRALVFQAVQHTANHLFRAPVDLGGIQALTGGSEMNTAPSLDKTGRMLAWLREDSTHPRDVWVRRLPDGAPVRLSDANPQTREFLSFEKQLVTWQSTDGREIEGLLVWPAGEKPGGPVPLVVNVHGGPAGTHSNVFTGATRIYGWPLFAQRGYAVLWPNPRGSGGYGAAFRSANLRDWGGKDYEDIMTGVDELVRRGLADEKRLAVCGWSYGGFMTSTIVTKTNRFRAAVVGAGVMDLMAMAGTCDIPEFNYSYFTSWPWEDPKFYVDHSALMHAGHVKTPTALVHGLSDERVPTSQGWEFYNALKRVGVPTDLLLLPRQPHGPTEPRLLRTTMQWHLDWIDKYTLDAAPNGTK